MHTPKLRNSKKRTGSELYPLGQIPSRCLLEISKWFAFYYCTNKKDITGDNWGDAFSYAIGAKHLASPLGLADVVSGDQSWSTKTVKHNDPHTCKTVRIISGRNSPDYSYGIQNPHEDPQRTGTAVLGIWNERINIAKDEYKSLRSITLIRNFETMEFCVFEDEIYRVQTNEYKWSINKKGNLQGHRKSDNQHIFTWQPHGSQFTIKHSVPTSAIRFKIKKPPVLSFDSTLEQIGFSDDWLEII